MTEDEEFEDLERRLKPPEKAAPTEDPYISGWNSALEMAAFQLTHNFKSAFGPNTLDSVAAYIKGLKK